MVHRMDSRAGPTTYRVTVRGRISERLGAAFDDLTLERRDGRTVLIGPRDQVELRGVLERVRKLGIEVESVDADG
jgi:hypothetical protein